MSYSTYLVHPILLCVVFKAMQDRNPAPLGLALMSMLVVSWILWAWFKSPLLRIGHRLHY
jgi:peptidoglycan/LPS O-acetylase OafA/YrhL